MKYFIIRVIGRELALPESLDGLVLLKKGDPRKVACAALVKARTTVSNDWIAQRLVMGHPASMSQVVHRMRRNPKESKRLIGYEKLLKPKD